MKLIEIDAGIKVTVLRSPEIDNPLMKLTMSSKLAEVLGATVGDDIPRWLMIRWMRAVKSFWTVGFYLSIHCVKISARILLVLNEN
jgi:hypothetical protein